MQTLANGGDTDPVVFFTVILSLEVIATFFLWKRYQLITKLNNDAVIHLFCLVHLKSISGTKPFCISPKISFLLVRQENLSLIINLNC